MHGWHKLECVEAVGLFPAMLLEEFFAESTLGDNLWGLMNSVLLSAPGCLQNLKNHCWLLKKVGLTFFGLTQAQGRRSLELAVGGVGGNESHPTVSAHIPSQS